MPSRSAIFRKLFLSSLLVVALSLLTLDYTLTEAIPQATAAIHWRLWEAFLVAAVLALAAASLISRWQSRRVRRLAAFAEGLAKPSASASGRALAEANDELGQLGRTLNQTSGQFRELVDQLGLESARRDAILASLVEGVLAVDNELRVTFSNDALLRAVGASGPIPERLPLLELVREPELLNMLTEVLVTGEPCRQRIAFARHEGRSFEVQAAPLVAPSRRGAVAILHDITELERLEGVRKDFVANVSHELRTPLTAIRGYAETLLEGALEDHEHNREFLEIIKNHAIRLNSIAADLLTLSELESKRAPAEWTSISVREALESAIGTVGPEARARNVAIRSEPGQDIYVSGERHRFEQALVNLLDNAVKFNRPGGEVQTRADRTPEGLARVVIADTGIGIPSRDLTRVFERFYRVDKARSREMGGTGLGLSIVRHVVERMGGSVSLESQLGKGSTFTLLLPGRDKAS